MTSKNSVGSWTGRDSGLSTRACPWHGAVMRVAVATCRLLPEPDPDQAPLLSALRDAGVEAQVLAWDDPGAPDLHSFNACILRSTWNYYEDLAGFLRWAEGAAAATRLENPLSIVRWNCHKTYLSALAQRGVRVVPTEFVTQGQRPELAPMAARLSDDLVIKPTVSASSFATRRFRPGEAEEAQRYLLKLAAERDVMVQRYMPSVEGVGERALVWIDGELTHAVRKSPRFSGEDEHVGDALPISPEERAFAFEVLRAVPDLDLDTLLYGRVDVVRDDKERLCVAELELIEPSLFLVQNPAAMERLVLGIACRVSA
jgi:glutathione synthase/RimK-type ligase-like ATP-grasp enzyme